MTERSLFQGKATGGPLDGQEIESRFPAGLIVIDRAQKLSGVYHRQHDKGFVYVEDNSWVNDRSKLDQAAASADFDIRSL